MKTLFVWSRLLGSLAIIVAGALLLSACTTKNQSGLQVLSNDIPSAVYLDGKYVERTPYISKELKPAEYSLEIRPDDPTYVPYQTKLSLKTGTLTVVNWQPGKRPETSGGVIFETEPLRDKKATELLITTIPDGGIIYVDGEAKGLAPVTVRDLSKGEHQFEVKLPSYESITKPINILEGYRVLVTVKLGKQDYVATFSAQTIVSTGSARVASSATGAAPTTTSSRVTGTKVTIRPTGFEQDGQEVLRVRAESNSSSTEIGFAPVGSSYSFLQEVRDGWIKIQFGNQVGWVSQQFVTVE
ncbi:PEGA domain-containing protein [Patescibacteria group bacterium]|nr:PEGA domain-containing protein [Patescibacteria group bacterium]